MYQLICPIQTICFGPPYAACHLKMLHDFANSIKCFRGLMPESAESYALMSVFVFPDTINLPR